MEVLWVVAGLAVAFTLGWLSAWSYPLGRQDIWLVTGAGMVLIVAMALPAIIRAARADLTRVKRAQRHG
ncbi:hypothetical protein [Stakelama sediminis]|nr:hypothetical protein [Stakelama sediminis]